MNGLLELIWRHARALNLASYVAYGTINTVDDYLGGFFVVGKMSVGLVGFVILVGVA